MKGIFDTVPLSVNKESKITITKIKKKKSLESVTRREAPIWVDRIDRSVFKGTKPSQSISGSDCSSHYVDDFTQHVQTTIPPSQLVESPRSNNVDSYKPQGVTKIEKIEETQGRTSSMIRSKFFSQESPKRKKKTDRDI